MTFHENKLSQTQVKVTNTSGATYVQGQLVLEQGYFGNVVDDLAAGIINGAECTIDIDDNRTIQTDQTKAGDTFTESTDETPSVVYFDRTNAYLTDTNAAGLKPGGAIVEGGAADPNDFIWFKPYAQSSPSGVVPAGSIGTAELADDAVTSPKIDEGVIQTVTKTLTAAEVKTLYSANTNQGLEIVAAQADKVIEFISASLRYNYDGSNAYTAANGLTFNVAAVAVSDLLAVTFLQGTADRAAIVQALSAEIDQDLSALTNKALYLQEGTADPTGSAVEADTVLMVVSYKIHDLSV